MSHMPSLLKERYKKLIDELWDTKYLNVLGMYDESREGDVYDMRRHFQEDTGFTITGYEDDEINLIEFLVAFTRHLVTQCLCKGCENNIIYWMVDNLGLLEFDDKHYDDKAVNEIIYIWLYRKFDRMGHGSPFPLIYNEENFNMRKEGIWDMFSIWYYEHACVTCGININRLNWP